MVYRKQLLFIFLIGCLFLLVSCSLQKSNLDQGNESFNNKDFDMAIQHFEKAVEDKPEDYKNLNKLALSYKKKGDLEKAIESYKKAIAVKPNAGMLYNNLGKAYYAKGEYDLAIENFETALKNKLPENELSQIYNNLGVLYSKNKQYDLSIENFKKSEEKDPTNQLILYNLCNVYTKASELELAIEYCNKTLATTPEDAKPYFMLARVSIQKKDFDKAYILIRDGYIKLGQKLPAKGFTNFEAGFASYKLEKYDDAIKYLNYQIAENPDDGYAYYILGLAYLKKEENNNALKSFSYALKNIKRGSQVYNEIIKIKSSLNSQKARRLDI